MQEITQPWGLCWYHTTLLMLESSQTHIINTDILQYKLYYKHTLGNGFLVLSCVSYCRTEAHRHYFALGMSPPHWKPPSFIISSSCYLGLCPWRTFQTFLNNPNNHDSIIFLHSPPLNLEELEFPSGCKFADLPVV